MKQKSSRVLTEKKRFDWKCASSRGKAYLPEGANRKRFEGGNRIEADRRGPPVRFKKLAGAEPRRVRRNGGYQELQRLLPRRWVVDSSNREHHVDGDTFSGGRRLGWWWRTPVEGCKLRIEARVRKRDA